MTKKLFLLVGIASVLLLGAVILFHSPPTVDELPTETVSPVAELEHFMYDKMNYGVKLSRILAERRIAKCVEYARSHPELEGRAREVADSLRARLDRNAEM